jgi:hypothetical protein
MSVYLPEDLYQRVKRDGIAVSEVLQEALRARDAVNARLRALDDYLDSMTGEVGEPGPAQTRAADALTRRVLAHDLGAGQAALDEDDVQGDEPPPVVRRPRRTARRAG